MKVLLKFLAAALGSAGIVGLKAALATLTGSVSGEVPADVNPALFGVLAAAVIALAAYLVGKLPK